MMLDLLQCKKVQNTKTSDITLQMLYFLPQQPLVPVPVAVRSKA